MFVRDGALFLRSSEGDEQLAAGEPENGWTLADDPWSPDGRYLAAVRSDLREVYHIPVHDYSDPIPPTTLVPYAKSGDAMPRAELHVFDVEKGAALAIDLGQGEFYLHVEGWRLGGRELLVQRTSRNAQLNELLAVDPEVGTVRSLLTETSATFVGGLEFFIGGWRDVYVPIADGERFLWRSERDGWAHLYLYDSAGDARQRQTHRGRVSRRAASLAVDEDRTGRSTSTHRRRSGPTTATSGAFRSTARSPPNGSTQRRGPALRLAFALLPSSSSTRTRASGGRPSSELRQRRKAASRSRPRARRRHTRSKRPRTLRQGEPFVAKAADGKTDLHGDDLRARGTSTPTKSYAVDRLHLRRTVAVRSAARLSRRGTMAERRARALAQLGYVVFMVDARGTPGRSKAFLDANYGIIGQVVGARPRRRAASRSPSTRPYMDTGPRGHLSAPPGAATSW